MLDGRVLAVTALIAVATGLGFALLPALRLTGGDAHEELRSGARQAGAAGHSRLRRLLVGGQMALALMLLVGAGLLLRSLLALTRVDPGFRAAGVVTASLPLRPDAAADAPRTWRFADDLLERIEALPEVESASLTSGLSLRGGGWGKHVSFGDRPPPASRDQVPTVGYRLVSRDYFRTLGVRLVAGRPFTRATAPTGPRSQSSTRPWRAAPGPAAIRSAPRSGWTARRDGLDHRAGGVPLPATHRGRCRGGRAVRVAGPAARAGGVPALRPEHRDPVRTVPGGADAGRAGARIPGWGRRSRGPDDAPGGGGDRERADARIGRAAALRGGAGVGLRRARARARARRRVRRGGAVRGPAPASWRSGSPSARESGRSCGWCSGKVPGRPW